MSVPSFEERARQWSSPPVDDWGYVPAKDLLALDDESFARMMAGMWHARYEGWRNHQGRWVELFGMHAEGGITGKRILDYGCGVGMEGAQYLTLGNEVFFADISQDNLWVAERLCLTYDKVAAGLWLITNEHPIARQWPAITALDIIHCCGVLHHIPEPEPVVEAMAGWLIDGGRLHLMVYSDYAWRIATKKQTPPKDVLKSEHFETYWRHWDAVGGYADWYDERRLAHRFGQWFSIERCEYLTADRAYLGAVLVKR